MTGLHPNKTIPRVLLAAAAVLILCGALFCGAAAADDNGDVAKIEETGEVSSSVQVTFIADNGTEQSCEQPVTSGVLTTLKPEKDMEFTEPDGKKFIGWMVKDSEPAVYYTDQQAVNLNEDLTLIAQWGDVTYIKGSYSISKNGYYQLQPDEGDVINDSQITVYSGVLAVLDLNGNVLRRFDYKDTIYIVGGGAVLRNDGVLTLTDSNPLKEHTFTFVKNNRWRLDSSPASDAVDLDKFDCNLAEASAAGSYHIKINGGVITGGGGEFRLPGVAYAGGVLNSGNGTFTMSGGNIVGNCACYIDDYYGGADGLGGGVYNDGWFTMTGGSIAGNNVWYTGGGVYNEGTFNMFGGTITGNTTPYADNRPYDGQTQGWVDLGAFGGGVSNSGTFNMNGGTISRNSSSGGGGVYNTGTFTLNGGRITENRAITITYATYDGRGGGVWNNGGWFAMTGGSIAENMTTRIGGGVYVPGGTFVVEGSPVITNNLLRDSQSNTVTKANNVHLDGTMYVSNPLENDADIHITHPVGTGDTFACGNNGYQVTETDASRFHPDNSPKLKPVAADGDAGKVLKWAVSNVTVTFDPGTGSGTSQTQEVTTGTSVRIPTIIELSFTAPAGQEFSGFQGSDGNRYASGDVITVSSDITLTALWGGGSTIVYHKNDGSATEETKSFVHSTVGTTPLDRNVFQRDGYYFLGWSNDRTIKSKYFVYGDGEAVTLSSGGLNLYAQWVPVSEAKSITAGTTVINDNGYYIPASAEVPVNLSVTAQLAVIDL